MDALPALWTGLAEWTLDLFADLTAWLDSSVFSAWRQFLDGSYYGSLVDGYFSMEGFIAGFIFLLMLYFSVPEAGKKAGVFRLLLATAVINQSFGLLYQFHNFFGSSYEDVYVRYLERNAYGMFGDYGIWAWSGVTTCWVGIGSVFLTALLVFNCYKGHPWKAFLLHLTLVFAEAMFGSVFLRGEGDYAVSFYFDYLFNLDNLLCYLLFAFTCALASGRKYFYHGWLLCGLCHVILIPGLHLLTLWDDYSFYFSQADGVLAVLRDAALDIWYSVTTDALALVLYFLILLFAVLFERGVLEGRKIPAPSP